MTSPDLDPSWPVRMTDEVLRNRFGESATRRGLAYAQQGRVGRIECGGRGRLLTAQVTGGHALPYQVLVVAEPQTSARPRPPGVSGRCSCPKQSDCKHVVALIAHARLLPLVGVSEAPPPAPWQRVLDAALTQAREAAFAAGPDATPVALQVTFGRSPLGERWGSRAPTAKRRLLLRPLIRGASGRWIKTGASWEDVLIPTGRQALVPDHREALRRLHALRLANRYAYLASPEHLDIEELGPHAWTLLAEAVAAGVALVPGDRHDPPVRLAEPAAFGVTVESDGDGGARLTPHVTLEGRRLPPVELGLLGSPPHGVVLDDRSADRPALVVAGFATALRPAEAALATGPEQVHVPAEQLPRFAASYYPALRRVARLEESGDVDLPAIEPPRLSLEASFEADHQVVLRWCFRYRLADEELEVPVVPDRAAPAPAAATAALDIARDPEAEQALIDALPLPDRPDGLTVEVGSRRALVPVQRFAGHDTIGVATELLPALAELNGVDVTVLGEPIDYREAHGEPVIEVSLHDADPARDTNPAGPAGGTDPAGPPRRTDQAGRTDPHARLERTDWFDLGVHVRVDGELVPFQGLFTALARGQSHLVLHSGTYFSLDRPALHQLRALIEESRHLRDRDSPDTLSVGPQHAGLWEELVAIGVVTAESQAWVRAVGALLDLDTLPAADPPDQLLATLRPYQFEGYRWLTFLWRSRLGGVLADDMGLGKTLQTLAAAARAAEDGQLDGAPLLVVAPTSVVATWQAEARRFTPKLRVCALTETSRRRRREVAESIGDAQVVVTSYAIARLDAAQFQAGTWSALVLDEAQFVKNHRSKTYHAVRRIPAPVRFAISGTPLENSLMDLWSLLSITAPGLFPDPEAFADVYKRPIEEGTDPAKLPRLLRHVRPLMLRRTKESVAADLPPKQEQVVSVTLAPAHRRVYDTHLHRERQKVLGLVDNLQRHRMAIFRSLTLLRLLSLAPGLGDADAAGVRATKLDVLLELLEDVVAGGHRALVFSQFTGFLAMVRERLRAQGIGHVYLDGRTRNRAARIATFREGTDPVFCISLKAGGFGLTLTEADYVFVLDPWWNPAAEEQAIDRTHRIGQDKHVMVYRLVAADTIEEKVVALQERKRDLFAKVVGGGGDASGALSAEDIRGLLEG